MDLGREHAFRVGEPELNGVREQLDGRRDEADGELPKEGGAGTKKLGGRSDLVWLIRDGSVGLGEGVG